MGYRAIIREIRIKNFRSIVEAISIKSPLVITDCSIPRKETIYNRKNQNN